MKGTGTGAGTAVKTGLKIVAVCLVFGVCIGIGGALAGVAKLVPIQATAQASSSDALLPFAVFCLSAGGVVSFLILRSSWCGLKLAGVLFVATYGISTIATQVESLFFLSSKVPPGLIRALFVQGTIAMALFAPLAVLILGKWRRPLAAVGKLAEPRVVATTMTLRIALLVVAFVFLYLFFGYYVAWQNPSLRQYYGGHEFGSFFGSLKSNWADRPSVYGLQVFRALLYVVCVFPLIRMLNVARWEKAAAIALFLAVWTTALLIPNPLMPPSVAQSHFWETLAFNLSFGALLGWLLSQTTPSSMKDDNSP